MLMKVWHCYFEHCNNDSNFQCQITASRRKREMGGGKSREKKKGKKEKNIVSGLIEFVISLAVPDRWIMNTV